jgi:hypothetical protein
MIHVQSKTKFIILSRKNSKIFLTNCKRQSVSNHKQLVGMQ